ncbi:MAG: DUF4249 domain-containing protein [Bacteroidota bacterium]
MKHILSINPSLFLVLFLGAGIFTGCIEEIELKEPDLESELVISGSISPGITTHQVEIFISSPFGDLVPEYVKEADVAVVDEQGRSYTFEEKEAGVYTWLNENRPILVGESFYLTVSLADGRKFQSSLEKIPQKIPVQNTYFEVNTDITTNERGSPLERKFVDIYVDIELPESDESTLLRWETDRVYVFREVDWPKPPCDPRRFPGTCYIIEGKAQPEEVILLDGDDYQVGAVDRIWVGRKRLDSTFNQLSVFSIFQKSTSRSSFTYWDDVSRVASPGGSIFDIPPSPVRGNIFNTENEGEIVLGNFEAVNTDTVRLPIYPTDLDMNFIPPYCQPRRFRPCEYYAPCLFCWLIPNYTMERPSYLP